MPAPCYLADSPRGCFEEHRRRLLKIRYPSELIPCQSCPYARQNAEIAFVPEPDQEAAAVRVDGTHRRGPLPKDACHRGHARAVYGRKQLTGRDKGRWACRECERINLANRWKAKPRFCADCGKPTTINAKRCQRCQEKRMTSKKFRRVA